MEHQLIPPLAAVAAPPAWSADDPLAGSVLLPDGRGDHALEPLVAALAGALRTALSALGLPAGSPAPRIAVSGVTACAALALSAAARRLRVPLVWLNDRWGAAESARALRTSDARALLTGGLAAPAFASGALPVLAVRALPATDVRALRAGGGLRAAHAHAGDEAVFFTSGSGGRARGARLAHASMDVQASAKRARLPFGAPDAVYLHLAPHFHVGGASSALAALAAGAAHAFPPPAAGPLPARAGALLALADARRVSLLVVVPGVLRALADAAEQRGRPARSVRCMLVGAARAGAGLRAAAREAFPAARFVSAYGLTEAASSVAFAEGAGPARPPPHVELAVAAPLGASGQVLTRGAHVMRGYCGEPERSPGDWLRTGDLGAVDDDGGLRLVGRARDVIRTGGESVVADEVERALEEHPAVAESAVVGVAHALLGEAVAAAVVVDSAREKGPVEELRDWCRERLSPYKVPKWIFQVDRLPTNALGKVVKPTLRVQIERRLREGGPAATQRAKL